MTLSEGLREAMCTIADPLHTWLWKAFDLVGTGASVFLLFFSPFPWWQIGPPWLVGQELEAVVCVLRVKTLVLTAPSGIAQWKFEKFCLPFARDPSLGIHLPLLCFG